MTENGVFRSDSIFSKKWQKPRVEALKRSEIECLGFTERERDLLIAYFSSFFPLFKIKIHYIYTRDKLKFHKSKTPRFINEVFAGVRKLFKYPNFVLLKHFLE